MIPQAGRCRPGSRPWLRRSRERTPSSGHRVTLPNSETAASYRRIMAEARICPRCGQSILPSLDHTIEDELVHCWIGTCPSCDRATGEIITLGLDDSGNLVPLESFRLDRID